VPEQIANRDEINHLIKVLIPQLDTKLRVVFLFRHESEYWDGKQPFQWQHIAELNQTTAEEAGQSFVQARDSLVTESTSLADNTNLSAEDQLIFLVWTQAHRFDKSKIQTESYFASLLNIPLNTFKTRYRAALSELSSGLDKWRNQPSNQS